MRSPMIVRIIAFCLLIYTITSSAASPNVVVKKSLPRTPKHEPTANSKACAAGNDRACIRELYEIMDLQIQRLENEIEGLRDEIHFLKNR
jgi:hypothetical protein